MRLKMMVGGALALVLAGVLANNVTGGSSGTDADNQRRRYTLVAHTSMNRAQIEARVTSSVRGNLLTIAPWRAVRTQWKQSVWAEAGEVVKITLRVRTYGDHKLRTQLWSRCQILRNGAMEGGDTEVNNVYVENVKEQTQVECRVVGG